MTDTVYLAVQEPFGPGDDFQIDDSVYICRARAERRAYELGVGWRVWPLGVWSLPDDPSLPLDMGQ